MTCPYPPSDPVCQAGPTTTTTLQHVIVDNSEDFSGRLQTSVDGGPDTVQAIQHQTHVMVVGFTVVVLVIVIVGAGIAAGIHDYLGKQAK